MHSHLPSNKMNDVTLSINTVIARRLINKKTNNHVNWFFNNWGPPHPDVEVYQQWVAIGKEALSEKGATEAERALFFGGAAAKAYGLRTADEA